jgi:hypothetical protein
MVVLFSPQRMQVSDPVMLAQEICLFAAVAAVPAVMVGEPKSTVEYASVHSTAAGSELAGFKLRFNVTELPAAAEPDESPSATDWARQTDAADTATKSTTPT